MTDAWTDRCSDVGSGTVLAGGEAFVRGAMTKLRPAFVGSVRGAIAKGARDEELTVTFGNESR